MSNKDNITSWVKQQLTLAAVVFMGLQLLPAFVILLKPLLATFAVAVLIVLTARVLTHHFVQRRQRW